MAKVSEKLSLPKTQVVHGVEVKKLPCGKYFEAIEVLKELPINFINELKKELKIENEAFKLSEMLATENIMTLVAKMFVIIPDFTFKALSKLLDIEEDKIRNKLTPVELLDIIRTFYELNELESFFVQTKSAMSKILTLAGFKK